MKGYQFLACLLICFFSSGQEYGNLDMTFNPYDVNMYFDQTGFNGKVWDAVEVGANSYIAVGEFFELNGVFNSKIVHINGSQGYLSPPFPHSLLGGNIQFIEKQSDGKLIIAGSFNNFNGNSTRIVRLNPDLSFDHSFTLISSFVGIIKDLKVDLDDRIYVAGYQMYFDNMPHNGIMRLYADGGFDPSFNTSGGTNDFVNNISIAFDGSVFIDGNFTYYGVTPVNGYVKLLSNGQIDSSFGNGLSAIKQLKVADDGNIFCVQNNNQIRRLLPDGSIDSNFYNESTGNNFVYYLFPKTGGGVYYVLNNNVGLLNNEGVVLSFSIQVDYISHLLPLNDGFVLLMGDFNSVDGSQLYKKFCVVDSLGESVSNPLNFGIDLISISGTVAMYGDDRIALGAGGIDKSSQSVNFVVYKLDGSIDTAYMQNIGAGANQTVKSLKSLDNGKLLVAGGFTSIGGVSRQRIARLNIDGNVDTTFVPPVINGDINSIDVQTDEKILIAGNFTSVNGIQRYYVARLNTDGSFDSSFSSPLYNNVVFGMGAHVVKAGLNNKILVGGKFACCNNLLRLNDNGTIDTSFGGSYSVTVIHDAEELSDGSVLYCGVSSPSASIHDAFYYKALPNGQYDGQFNAFQSNSGTRVALNIEATNNGTYLITGNLDEGKMYTVINSSGEEILTSNMVVTTGGYALDATIQKDGKIVFIGTFDNINNKRRNHVARIQHYTQISDKVCSNELFSFGNLSMENPSAGYYYDTIISSLNSDSIILMNVSLFAPINSDVSVNENILSVDCIDCLVQWRNCITGDIIEGETSQSYIPSENGEYNAILFLGECSDTTICTIVELDVVGVDTTNRSFFSLYPNPSNGSVKVNFYEIQPDCSYYLYDLLGKEVASGNIGNNSSIEIELPKLKGTYIFTIMVTDELKGIERINRY